MKKILKYNTYDTKLDSQIEFMKTIDCIIKTPMVIAIIDSLRELKGIKQNQINKLKMKNEK